MARFITVQVLVWLSLLLALICTRQAHPQADIIPFDPEYWDLARATVTEHLGQQCLVGTARLNDIRFTNGIIEYDMVVDGSRCYPGIRFRLRDEGDFEEFYIRPHHSNDPAALQYTPAFNGISSWQLYTGPGFTAAAELPIDRWFHIRLEISGTQARVFLDESDRPALVVHELQHGARGGALVLQGPPSGSAYFANFHYQPRDDLVFAEPLLDESPPGIITTWQLSQPLKVSRLNRELPLASQDIPELKWQDVTAARTGLVDIARHVGRSGREPDCVLARTTLTAEQGEVKKLVFGYSDDVSIFLNGKLLFTGNSAYRSRDPSFLGALGLHDAVCLELRQGDNELLLTVTESMGGWGFVCQLDEVGKEPIRLHSGISEAWQSSRQLAVPESVVYDPLRKVFYVSNYYNGMPSGNADGNEFLSKVKPDGEIEQQVWVSGLNRPTGQFLHQDRLFVVERTGLVEIDPAKGVILKRHAVPDAVFLNDVAIDPEGQAFISDSARHVIYRLRRGVAEVWYNGYALESPNGLCLYEDRLLVGNSGDGCLKAIDLASKEIQTLAYLGSGAIIDGICPDGGGNFLVSDWNGRVFRVTPEGARTELLNMTVPQFSCADFTYIAELHLVVIPTFQDNRLLAYEIR